MSKPPLTSVAVAIVHYGNESITLKTLSSVISGDVIPTCVMIVDNGPTQWSSVVPENIEVLGPSVNRGYAGAVNAAAGAAAGKGCTLLWVLNNDVEVNPAALQLLLAVYRDHPEADIIGSLVTSSRDGKIWFGGGVFNHRTGRAHHDLFGLPVAACSDGEVRRTDWINGCSMLIPMQAFERRGYFDERFFLYKEELDWQVRGEPAEAWVIRLPLVRHAVGATTGTSDGSLGRMFMARNGLLLVGRRRGWRQIAWFLGWAWDFVLLPTLKGDAAAVRSNLAGASLVRSSPERVLGRL